MKRYYCTYFDHNYFVRALALVSSLERCCDDFLLFALCLSEEAEQLVRAVRNARIVPVSLQELEAADSELAGAKNDRTLVEYFFTITPCLPWFLLQQHPEIDMITYLDSDVYFFSDPEQLFSELEGASVGLVGHRFPPRLKYMEEHGRFNVSWLSFRNDLTGREALSWYRKKCIEWCKDIPEPDRYADQKYLDRFPRLFPGIVEIAHRGANVAPFNLENHRITMRGSMLMSDGKPLVFYHFHGIKHLFGRFFESGCNHYRVRLPKMVGREIYRRYLLEWKMIRQQYAALLNGISVSEIRFVTPSIMNSNFPLTEKMKLLRNNLRYYVLPFVHRTVVMMP